MTRTLYIYRPEFAVMAQYAWRESGCTHDRPGTTVCSRCLPMRLAGGVLVEDTSD